MTRIGTRLWLLGALGAGAVALAMLLLAPVSPFSGEGEPPGIAGWPPPPEVVERGRAIYQARCAVCHGANGGGEPNWQKQNVDGTYPAPPHDSSGHTWHHADGLLFEIVHDGGSKVGTATFRSRMPAWREVLTDEEIREVLTYLKTLWGPEERAFQAEVSERDPFPDDRNEHTGVFELRDRG